MAKDTARPAEEAPPPQQTAFEIDTDGGEPIDYALTARGRRVVAPGTLPDLTVLPHPAPSGAGPHDPFDTRPARARALRRAGRSVGEVAAALGVSEELAAGWCGAVRLRRGRRRPAPRPRGAPATGRPAPGGAASPVGDAARTLAGRIGAEPPFADGIAVGLLLALAVVTPHAVAVDVDSPGVAAAVARVLREEAGADSGRLRLLLRAGPAVARDLAAHRWSADVGLPLDRITCAPWPHAPDPGAVGATLRVADAGVAAVVSGWRQAVGEGLGAAVS